MKITHGYVLLAVLVLLLAYSLLGLTALEKVFISEKLNAHEHARHLAVNEGEKLLHQIAMELRVQLPRCQLEVIPLAQLRQKNLSWWENVACRGSAGIYQYYYVIEALGENPCAHLRNNNESGIAYQRISLLLTNETGVFSQVYLQMMVLVPAGSSSCQGEPYIVESGAEKMLEV